MAYCKFPPPSAMKFDLSAAKFMHSHINRMYIQNSMSYCVTVGTGKLPNPKYQRYYDAERDYLVPYNSGDTGEKSCSSSSASKSVESVDDYYCQMEDMDSNKSKSNDENSIDKSSDSNAGSDNESNDSLGTQPPEDNNKVVSNTEE